jgi:hypothetical protein
MLKLHNLHNGMTRKMDVSGCGIKLGDLATKWILFCYARIAREAVEILARRDGIKTGTVSPSLCLRCITCITAKR